jgi:hypothetical protein
MEYIKDNVEVKKISSPDNHNNVLSEIYTDRGKREIAKTLDLIIDDIKQDSRFLIEHFPEPEE